MNVKRILWLLLAPALAAVVAGFTAPGRVETDITIAAADASPASGQVALAAPDASPAVVTGGVTEEARDEMLRHAAPYNLRLAFAEKGTGAYLADVAVTVADGAGRPVIDVVTDGPWLFARVPPGTYKVRAAGAPEQRVSVDASGHAPVVIRLDPQP